MNTKEFKEKLLILTNENELKEVLRILIKRGCQFKEAMCIYKNIESNELTYKKVISYAKQITKIICYLSTQYNNKYNEYLLSCKIDINNEKQVINIANKISNILLI